MAASSLEADPTQQGTVERLIKLKHHVMVNCGPGTGKTTVMKEISEECKRRRIAFLAAAFSDRAVGNLLARGMGGANLPRVLAELKRLETGSPMSPVARDNQALADFLRALKGRTPAVLAIDECGLVSAELFDAIVGRLVRLNPMCLRDRRILFYMTADFSNQLAQIEGNPFVFSRCFDLIRENTYFPRFTKQFRFGQGTTGRDVAELLAAADTELEAYLRAQQRAYSKLTPARLARLATFVISRIDCEQHIRHALAVCFDGEPIPSYTVTPATGYEESTASKTTAATYWMIDGMKTMVEVTTWGGALKGATEDGDEVLIPNRAVCELVQLYDVPEAAGADSLAGKATAAVIHDDRVVTVPLVRKHLGINCVVLRTVGIHDGDAPVVEGHVTYNAQGYEYPGTLAVGTLGSTEPRRIERETLLVIATRTPLGPQHALFSPQIHLKRTNPAVHAAYRKQLALFTPHQSGNGLTMAAGTARPTPKRVGVAPRPASSSKRPRGDACPGAFLGSLY